MKTFIKHSIQAILIAAIAIGSMTPADARAYRVDRVEANDTDTWTFTLHGGCKSRIIVNGDGDTDLDAWLYDENGNLIDSDTDGTDTCVLDCTPKWTGQFKLLIRNHGNVWNQYELSIID